MKIKVIKSFPEKLEEDLSHLIRSSLKMREDMKESSQLSFMKINYHKFLAKGIK